MEEMLVLLLVVFERWQSIGMKSKMVLMKVDCSKYKRVSTLKEKRSSHRRKTRHRQLGEREQQRVDEVRYEGNGAK